MGKLLIKLFGIGLVIAFVVWLNWWQQQVIDSKSLKNQIILLIQDDVDENDAILAAWLKAAKEEGITLSPLKASDYLLIPSRQTQAIAGLIIPDTIHRKINDPLFTRISEYVNKGGNLLLAYDAGIENTQGAYEAANSKMSVLAGVRFGLYASKKTEMIERGSILLNSKGIADLHFPPGRFVKHSDKTQDDNVWAATSYRYPVTHLPYFVTEKVSDLSNVLALSEKGSAIFTENKFGMGSVLFINMPVGYLATRTDGIFLHVLLRNFAWDKLHLPMASTVPDGIGGIVMNWHIDAGNAEKYLDDMHEMGFYSQGPYSIHITSGPDSNALGDGLGLHVSSNPSFQQWMKDMKAGGHDLGAHGGWIHNYFALTLTEKPTEIHQQYLAFNKADIENVIQSKVTEYSAPNGHQPVWITQWLIEHGFKAYYDTGNIGLGPTRVSLPNRNKDNSSNAIWAFPVSTFGQVASFEEARSKGLDNAAMQQWLLQMTQFCVTERAARLIYFHPPGLSSYASAAKAWLNETRRLKDAGVFRWYTMTALANFLETKQATSWQQEVNRKGEMEVKIANPIDLEHQAWLFDGRYYGKPVIVKGSAQIFKDSDVWRVVAKKSSHLELTLKRNRL